MPDANEDNFERTMTRADCAGEPEWTAGYQFRGVPTPGGIRDLDHPDRIVHHADCVQRIDPSADVVFSL